jgi:hypothetical protein
VAAGADADADRDGTHGQLPQIRTQRRHVQIICRSAGDYMRIALLELRQLSPGESRACAEGDVVAASVAIGRRDVRIGGCVTD